MWQRTLGSGPPILLALGASSVAEAPEDGLEIISELVDREVEIPEEITPTFDLLPKEDVVTMASSSTPDTSELSHRLSSRVRELLKLH